MTNDVDTSTDGARSGPSGRRVLLGVTGGIAAYKAVLLARLLVQAGVVVDAVLTRGARHFVGAATFEGITGRPVRSEVWEDIEHDTHVALARAADAVVVYPATAHTLAKMRAGLADDLLTASLLAAECPVLVAPAMHTEMWRHPATTENVAVLRERGVTVVGPADGPLMGGDVGPGRVVEPEEMWERLRQVLGDVDAAGDLAGRTFVVTAGGTREHLDPVRFLGNRSTGKMGFAIAAVAAARGAEVHLVAAPTWLATPAGVTRHDVTSAREMHACVLDLAASADVVVKAAAVADYRPATVVDAKIKKRDGTPEVALVANPDILADLGAAKRERGHGPLLVGFAAETANVEVEGAAKLARKGADLLVANLVGGPEGGFGTDDNRVTILAADGSEPVSLPLMAKEAVASALLDQVVARLD